VRVVIHERDEREKEKERETLRKKNSSSFPLNSVSVDDFDALIKRNVVSKKDEKRRKKEGSFFFFFRRLPLLHLSASVSRFTPIIFIIINIIIRFLLEPMNNECTNALLKWL
jgi:hypothetical protein